MTQPVAYRSTDGLVLAVWEQSEAEHDHFATLMEAEQQLLGRCLFTRQPGLGRRAEIVGIEHLPGADIPDGWCLQHRRHFLRPLPGSAGAHARAWLTAHQPPPPAEDLLAPFGVRPYVEVDGFVHWPGLERHDDGLYLTWPVEVGWGGGEAFERVPLSAFYAARERAAGSDLAFAATTSQA